MIIDLKRFQYSETETMGLLILPTVTLFTIERPWVPVKAHKGGLPFSSCVPDGLYELISFSSDKYPETPRGLVPLKPTDPMAQDLLWEYARRRRKVDAEFADDLEDALSLAGYVNKYDDVQINDFIASQVGWLSAFQDDYIESLGEENEQERMTWGQWQEAFRAWMQRRTDAA